LSLSTNCVQVHLETRRIPFWLHWCMIRTRLRILRSGHRSSTLIGPALKETSAPPRRSSRDLVLCATTIPQLRSFSPPKRNANARRRTIGCGSDSRLIRKPPLAPLPMHSCSHCGSLGLPRHTSAYASTTMRSATLEQQECSTDSRGSGTTFL